MFNPNSPGFSIALMVLLIVLIYLMMIRPQKKREKAENEMRAALKVGDEVITIGGVVGKVEKITDKTITISTGGAAKNKIEFLKTAIASVSKSEAAKGGAKASGKEAAEAENKEEEKAPDRDKKVMPKKLSK